ncbi:MAG: AAA family ATPase [Pyrinomonadaceae bacterium]|jgi:MoxR-like ATPase
MKYEKYFDYRSDGLLKQVQPPKPGSSSSAGGEKGALRAGDRRDGLVYVYNDKIELAVNVALVTGRPMLIRGPSGSGKSSLARNVARRMRWWYYEQVITSRTQARDLLWTFDSLRRLSDAQANRLNENAAHYVEPGVLWWAFDPKRAAARVAGGGQVENRATDPGIAPAEAGSAADGAVVLLDEIDKADPDVPNNLLVPLGSLEFRVKETGALVEASRPLLIMITTNDERVLPNAFTRRCVTLNLEPPNEELLVKIAREHYGPDKSGVYKAIARRVLEEMSAVRDAKVVGENKHVPSTAEYLDTVRAFMDLGVDPETDAEAWRVISSATIWKDNPGL